MYKDRIQAHAIKTLPFGGGDLTDLLMKMLNPVEPFVTTAHRIEAMGIKELHCYVPEVSPSITECPSVVAKHSLPDQRTLELDKEAWIVGEALFNPNLFYDQQNYNKTGSVSRDLFRLTLLV